MGNDDGQIHLKINHNHYYQAQGQLAILNLPWYDSVVWTGKDVRIDFDETFSMGVFRPTPSP